MTDAIEIIERQETVTLEASVCATMFGIPAATRKAYMAIAAILNRHDIAPSEAPFIRYLDIDWDKHRRQSRLAMFIWGLFHRWNMRIGMALPAAVPPEGDVTQGVFPGGPYLKTLHRGPYHKMGQTYKRLLAFADEKQLKLAPESAELYINDPRTTAPADLETVMLIRLLPQ